MTKKKRVEPGSEEIINNPFLALAQQEKRSAPPVTGSMDREEVSGKVSKGKPVIDRVILRKERKGHGGKTVTVVEIRPSEKTDMKEMAKKLKNALGCGGKAEGDLIVLQGDIAVRVGEFFRNMGVRNITF